MAVDYDDYYQTEDLFGAPYPELIHFYSGIKKKGKLLDLGCGQGRDSIPLAKLGFEVTAIDYSKVGIEQLNKIAQQENIQLKGIVADIHTFSTYDQFDFILLDSMFHFEPTDKKKEINLLNKIITESKSGTLITICIQKSTSKLKTLTSVITSHDNLTINHQLELNYNYIDQEHGKNYALKYEMITLEKH